MSLNTDSLRSTCIKVDKLQRCEKSQSTVVLCKYKILQIEKNHIQ